MYMGGETGLTLNKERARIRILCVDDHPLLRKGIGVMVNNEPDMVLIAEACNGPDAIELFRREQPDVTLMDLRLPGMSGVDATIAIRAEFPEARIVMLTTFEGDVEIQRALRAGAFAFMLKTMHPDEMVQTIRRVYAGKRCVLPQIAALLAEHYSEDSLTTREIEVLRQIAGGNRNRDIAENLFISEQTVKAHISHILEKLGASDRAEAVVIGTRRGIIQL
jgi:DNA-binding NarL/FixJ family response regulator